MTKNLKTQLMNEEQELLKTTKIPKRPEVYTEELGRMVCEAVSEGPQTLKQLAEQNPHLPHKRTINAWRAKYPDFAIQFLRARARQADCIADNLRDIALEATSADYNVKRLRIDTDKWYASKLLPKVYGDRIISETSEEVDEMRDQLKQLRDKLDAANKQDY